MLNPVSSNVLLHVWRTYRRFAPFVAPDILAVLADAFTIIIAVITNTLMIWLIGLPFDLVQKGQFDEVMQVLFWFAVVIVINQGMQLIGSWLTQWLGLRSIGRIRNALIGSLVQVSFPAANRWSKGDLLARLGNDVDSIKNTIVDAPLYTLSHILTATIYISMLFWIDTSLALVALVVMPLFVIHQRVLGSRKRRAAEEFVAKRGALIAFEEEALSNLRGISSANAEEFITRLHKTVFETARQWAMKERVVDIGFMVGFSFLIYATGLLIVFLGLDGIRVGRFGAGHLVSFLLFLGYLTVPARSLADIVFQAMGNLGAAQRILEILHAQPIVREAPDACDTQKVRGSIEFKDISFGYPGGAILYDKINLYITAGETIALVGPSGCGKSTLALLLLRFYDVSEGQILIDEIDLRSLSLSALRRHVAIVWQEPYIVSGTLRENLLMYAPEASEAQLIFACSASRAWEFIKQLPQRLDARIGVGGTNLSTGQKQRIAIAQAFLRDAPILIMDEATSALDSQSEQAVSAAMDSLRNGRTTILIAHRHSSLKSANRVAYFNGNGTLTVDRHEHLLQIHPGYKVAVDWQTGCSTPVSDPTK